MPSHTLRSGTHQHNKIRTGGIPNSFNRRKATILSSLVPPEDVEYTDKSPKGSVDEQIRELIDQINSVDGWVTTSSCAGRAAVFVEGQKKTASINAIAFEDTEADAKANGKDSHERTMHDRSGGPGGKGHGGKWLFVSHEPIPTNHWISEGNEVASIGGKDSDLRELDSLASFFGLQISPSDESKAYTSPRLIKLSFSPLILHVLCATLVHARHLLSAAINAGFRESGVQSLKALEDPDAGVMVGIRTAGLAFETVIGRVKEAGDEEVMERLVHEDYLRLCVKVINERFQWNQARRERLCEELRKVTRLEKADEAKEWEDKEMRRRRKREEGLKRKSEVYQQTHVANQGMYSEDSVLDEGLDIEF